MADTLVQLSDGSLARQRAVFAPAVNAGLVTLPPGATLGPRVQRDYQLVLVHAGLVRVAVDGVERRIPAGHVGLLRPERTEVFTFTREKETRHSWLALAPEQLDPAERASLDRAAPLLVLSEELRAVADLALRIVMLDLSPEDAALAATVRAGLLLYVAEAGRAVVNHQVLPETVQQARALIRTRAVEGLQVADLARAVGLSPEHLCRLYRRYLGLAPSVALREERLRLALQLLEHTGLPIAEVARRAGFGSAQYFARVLRAAANMAPTELRAMTWSAEQAQDPAASG